MIIRTLSMHTRPTRRAINSGVHHIQTITARSTDLRCHIHLMSIINPTTTRCLITGQLGMPRLTRHLVRKSQLHTKHRVCVLKEAIAPTQVYRIYVLKTALVPSQVPRPPGLFSGSLVRRRKVRATPKHQPLLETLTAPRRRSHQSRCPTSVKTPVRRNHAHGPMP